MEGFRLALVALKANAVRSCMLLQLLSCSKAKVALRALVLLAGGAMRVELRDRRVALTTLVASPDLSSWEESPRVLSITIRRRRNFYGVV